MKPSLLLADDHTIFTDALAHLLRPEFGFVWIARDGRAMVDMAKEYRPDVIVADITMPYLNGIDAARAIRRKVSSARILFLTMHNDLQVVEEAFRAGARGFVLKDSGSEEFLKALRAVIRGETYITPLLTGDLISGLITAGLRKKPGETLITPRQRQLLQSLAEGKTMKEAATTMNISTRTAESHKYEIMRKLGVLTTADLIRYAVRIKLV
jgi:DNA-binding NarL/FixJ family response regulator